MVPDVGGAVTPSWEFLIFIGKDEVLSNLMGAKRRDYYWPPDRYSSGTEYGKIKLELVFYHDVITQHRKVRNAFGGLSFYLIFNAHHKNHT